MKIPTRRTATVTSFPRSGNHRVIQTIASLLHNKPFEVRNYETVQEQGYILSHVLEIDGPVIFCVRHPFHVMQSCKAFMTFLKTWDDAFEYVAYGKGAKWGLAGQPAIQLGPWSNGVNTFKDRPDTLIIRYEDWGEESIRLIASFLHLPFRPEVLGWNTEDRIRSFGYRLPFSNRPHIIDEKEEPPVEYKQRLFDVLGTEMKLMGYDVNV